MLAQREPESLPTGGGTAVAVSHRPGHGGRRSGPGPPPPHTEVGLFTYQGSQAMCEEHRTESALERAGAQQTRPSRSCKPAEARRAVELAVTERCRLTHTCCDPEALGDALLVATELTTNAILHGGGMTDFSVDVLGTGVRVSVCDRSDRLPVSRQPADPLRRQRPGGHGWPIVCRLARDVQVSELPAGGKCITAVVALD